MDIFINIIWRIDYPLTLLAIFSVFFISLNKKKHFIWPLIIGIIALFGFWQIISIFKEIKNNVSLEMMMYIVEIGIFLVMCYFTLDIGLTSAMFVTQCVVSIQHLCYKFTLQLLNYIDINIYHQPYYFLIYYPILAVFVVITYFVFSRRLNEYVGFTKLLFNIIAFTLIILSELLASIYQQRFMFANIEDRLLITSLFNYSNIAISVLILSFLYISTIMQKRKDENLILSVMSSKERERFELAKITIDEINIKYHDLKHMLKNNEANINKEDLKEIKETVTNYKAIIQTNNVGLNVAVYEAQLKCINLGIDLNILVDGDSFSDFKPHHIYSMLSNLLDNAIDAVSEIKDNARKRIFFKVKTVRESIVLTLENYFDKKPIIINNDLITLKNPSKHGYGFKSVKRIVDLYNGVYDISIKDDKFVITIIFPKASKLDNK